LGPAAYKLHGERGKTSTAHTTIKAVIPVFEQFMTLQPLGSEFIAVSDTYRKQCSVTTCGEKKEKKRGGGET